MRLLLLAALMLGACSDQGTPRATSPHQVLLTAGADDRAALAGAGSTFAATIAEEWVRLYRTHAPGVDIGYDAIGSGEGIGRLVAGRSDFALSEVPMSLEEQRSAGWSETVQVPVVGGAVAVVYNLPGVRDLRLSEDTLARIFSGAITRWDAAAVKRDNPGAQLPPTAITTVHRADASGTTLAFSRYLATAGPDVWSRSPGMSVNWPVGKEAAGSKAVLAAVSSSAGAVGYVSAAIAGGVAGPSGPGSGVAGPSGPGSGVAGPSGPGSGVAGPSGPGSGVAGPALQVAHLRNAAGNFLAPTAIAVDVALFGASGFDTDLTLRVPDRQESPNAYPITAITHLVFPVGLPADKDVALRHFGAWILSEGQRSAARLGLAPLPLPLLVRTLEGLQNGGIKPSR